MPITKYGNKKLTICCTMCKSEQRVPIDDLKAGDRNNPNLIRLPLCPNCKAQELLNRVWDEVKEGHRNGWSFKHRSAVNSVHAYLVEKGNLDGTDSTVAVLKAEDTKPPYLVKLKPLTILDKPRIVESG